MKNIAIIVALAVVAWFAFTFINTEPTSTSPAPSVTTKAATGDNDAAEDASSNPVASLISSAPDNAAVFIIEPANGATVSSPVTVMFGITNMDVAPAGKNLPNSGHHHLLIDLDTLPDLTQPLPASDQLVHFGGGQTETTIELAPGKHTLQLLLGNYLHIPHDKPVLSRKIEITVE